MVRHHTPSLSFEVFLPNPAVGNEKIIQALREMQDIAPHYISVTASNNKFNIEETTVRLADFIYNDLEDSYHRSPSSSLSNQGNGLIHPSLDKVGVQKIFSSKRGYFPDVAPKDDFQIRD